jgi:succinate dehydrogenase / fumarate reductase membrane anchor subunit
MHTSNRGLRDWIVQRLTAVYMACYILLLFFYLLFNPHLNFFQWKLLFTIGWFQAASIVFVISLMWHAWIGVWTIITDYVKIPKLRLLIQSLVILYLLAFLAIGIAVVWSVPLNWIF